jgi:hypothetical protein
MKLPAPAVFFALLIGSAEPAGLVRYGSVTRAPQDIFPDQTQDDFSFPNVTGPGGGRRLLFFSDPITIIGGAIVYLLTDDDDDGDPSKNSASGIIYPANQYKDQIFLTSNGLLQTTTDISVPEIEVMTKEAVQAQNAYLVSKDVFLNAILATDEVILNVTENVQEYVAQTQIRRRLDFTSLMLTSLSVANFNALRRVTLLELSGLPDSNSVQIMDVLRRIPGQTEDSLIAVPASTFVGNITFLAVGRRRLGCRRAAWSDLNQRIVERVDATLYMSRVNLIQLSGLPLGTSFAESAEVVLTGERCVTEELDGSDPRDPDAHVRAYLTDRARMVCAPFVPDLQTEVTNLYVLDAGAARRADNALQVLAAARRARRALPRFPDSASLLDATPTSLEALAALGSPIPDPLALETDGSSIRLTVEARVALTARRLNSTQTQVAVPVRPGGGPGGAANEVAVPFCRTPAPGLDVIVFTDGRCAPRRGAGNSTVTLTPAATFSEVADYVKAEADGVAPLPDGPELEGNFDLSVAEFPRFRLTVRWFVDSGTASARVWKARVVWTNGDVDWVCEGSGARTTPDAFSELEWDYATLCEDGLVESLAVLWSARQSQVGSTYRCWSNLRGDSPVERVSGDQGAGLDLGALADSVPLTLPGDPARVAYRLDLSSLLGEPDDKTLFTFPISSWSEAARAMLRDYPEVLEGSTAEQEAAARIPDFGQAASLLGLLPGAGYVYGSPANVTWTGHVARVTDPVSGERRALPLFAGMLLSQWEDSAGRFLYSIDKTLYPETYPLCATDHPACSSSGAAASASPCLVSRANATHTLYEVFAETGEFELCAWGTRDEALTPAEFRARVNRTAAVDDFGSTQQRFEVIDALRGQLEQTGQALAAQASSVEDLEEVFSALNVSYLQLLEAGARLEAGFNASKILSDEQQDYLDGIFARLDAGPDVLVRRFNPYACRTPEENAGCVVEAIGLAFVAAFLTTAFLLATVAAIGFINCCRRRIGCPETIEQKTQKLAATFFPRKTGAGYYTAVSMRDESGTGARIRRQGPKSQFI